jgi:methionyl-tRNA formyltransferase
VKDPTAPSLRLAFFGTPEFATPTLERLLAGRHHVVSIVSQPDRRRGRGRRISASPVAEVASREELPLLRPEKVAAQEVEEALRASQPDLGVVVAFGQFVPKRIRELPALGFCINGHASLLPRWRGAAPIARAILAGDPVTGVSVMRLEREMDAGPVACRRELTIGPEETTGELAARLAELTADLVAEVLEEIAEGRIEWTQQDAAQVTLAPRLERADARLDWTQPAAALARRVCAMAPAPGAFTTLEGETLRILAARAEPGRADAAPGTVRDQPGGPLRIASGDGWLVPRVLQRAGGKPLDVDDYLRGKPIPDGTRLE